LAIPILKLKYESDNIYSPLSGKPAFTANGPNTRDRNLLFVFVGDAGEWGYVAKSVRATVSRAGKSLDAMQPAALCRILSIPGAVCLEVDTGWNGVNWSAWAPPAQE